MQTASWMVVLADVIGELCWRIKGWMPCSNAFWRFVFAGEGGCESVNASIRASGPNNS